MKSNHISMKEFDSETLSLKIYDEPYLVPKFEIIIDVSLSFTCIMFGFKVPDDHEIYKQHARSMSKITISELIRKLDEYDICDGVTTSSDTNIIHHVIPREINPEHIDISGSSQTLGDCQTDCHVLISSKEMMCKTCAAFTDSN